MAFWKICRFFPINNSSLGISANVWNGPVTQDSRHRTTPLQKSAPSLLSSRTGCWNNPQIRWFIVLSSSKHINIATTWGRHRLETSNPLAISHDKWNIPLIKFADASIWTADASGRLQDLCCKGFVAVYVDQHSLWQRNPLHQSDYYVNGNFRTQKWRYCTM